MSRRLRIRAGQVSAMASLNDSPTATDIWNALPIEARASTWGDEIYFTIPVDRPEERAQTTVSLGDLGYWPPGNAFCIFFGPTPMSQGAEIRPASPVNVVGHVESDSRPFRDVRSGAIIVLEAVPTA